MARRIYEAVWGVDCFPPEVKVLKNEEKKFFSQQRFPHRLFKTQVSESQSHVLNLPSWMFAVWSWWFISVSSPNRHWVHLSSTAVLSFSPLRWMASLSLPAPRCLPINFLLAKNSWEIPTESNSYMTPKDHWLPLAIPNCFFLGFWMHAFCLDFWPKPAELTSTNYTCPSSAIEWHSSSLLSYRSFAFLAHHSIGSALFCWVNVNFCRHTLLWLRTILLPQDAALSFLWKHPWPQGWV